jgi:hypothetical protein
MGHVGVCGQQPANTVRHPVFLSRLGIEGLGLGSMPEVENGLSLDVVRVRRQGNKVGAGR